MSFDKVRADGDVDPSLTVGETVGDEVTDSSHSRKEPEVVDEDESDDEADGDSVRDGSAVSQEASETSIQADNSSGGDEGTVGVAVGESDSPITGEDLACSSDSSLPVVRSDMHAESEKLLDPSSFPKSNSLIQYMLSDGKVRKAHMLSVQPKKTGTVSRWVNVKVIGESKPSSVNWDAVSWWRDAGAVSVVLVLSPVDECSEEVILAKEKELSQFEENNVYTAVDDVGQCAVSSKWVLDRKYTDGEKSIVKARLVARGFEEFALDNVDSPTCSRQTLRLVWVAAGVMNWKLCSLDITAAFLQGNAITREVYVRPPSDVAQPGKLWKLNRCLYGLSDAPREWYNRVKDELIKLGATVSLYDKCLFIWHEESKLVGILATHVDDFQYAGTTMWHVNVIDQLRQIFKISKMETSVFRYLGLNIEQTGDGVYVDQNAYVQDLKEIEIEPVRKSQINELLSDQEKKTLRSVCGQLQWATSQTRPDVAFETCRLSNSLKNATVSHLIRANKVIRKLKSTPVSVLFPQLGDPGSLSVIGFGDASHGSLPSGASQGGVIVFLSGNEQTAPVCWSSKKLKRVTKSPLASEVSVLADTGDTAQLVASMVKEIFALQCIPQITCFTDSNSLTDHLESYKVIEDARLRVDIARLREMIDLGEIKVTLVSGKQQLADSFTKAGVCTEKLLNAFIDGRFILTEYGTVLL